MITADRTTPTQGKPDAGTLDRTDAGTGTAAGAPTGTAETSTGTPDAANLLLDLQRLWTRPATAETTAAGKTATGPDASTGTATDGKTLTATLARTAGTPAPGGLARKPTAAELLAARTPARCLTHTAADLLDEPARNRPGYIRSICRRCGAFLGYRPAEPATHKRNARR